MEVYTLGKFKSDLNHHYLTHDLYGVQISGCLVGTAVKGLCRIRAFNKIRKNKTNTSFHCINPDGP